MKKALLLLSFTFFASGCFFTQSPLVYTQEMQSNKVEIPFSLDFAVGWNSEKPSISEFSVTAPNGLTLTNAEKIFEDNYTLVKRFTLKASNAGRFNIAASAFCNGNYITSPNRQVMVENADSNCQYNYDPICGSDEYTYSNECFANAVNVQVKYRGKCGGQTIATAVPMPNPITVIVSSVPIASSLPAMPTSATTSPNQEYSTVVGVITRTQNSNLNTQIQEDTQNVQSITAYGEQVIDTRSVQTPSAEQKIEPRFEEDEKRAKERSVESVPALENSGKSASGVLPLPVLREPGNTVKTLENFNSIPANRPTNAPSNINASLVQPSMTTIPTATPAATNSPKNEVQKQERSIVEVIVNFFSNFFLWK